MYFDAVEFGKRIKQLRVKNGMTQEMLAEKMNMSVMQVYRLERGVRMCTIDNLIMLHEIFNVDYQYLLEGRESEKKSQLEEKVLEMLNLVHKL